MNDNDREQSPEFTRIQFIALQNERILSCRRH